MLSDTDFEIRNKIYNSLLVSFRSCIVHQPINKSNYELLVSKSIWIDLFFIFIHNCYLNEYCDNSSIKQLVLNTLEKDICSFFKTDNFEMVKQISFLFEDKLDIFVPFLKKRKRLIAMVAERNWLQGSDHNKKTDLDNWVEAEKEVERNLKINLDDTESLQVILKELKSINPYKASIAFVHEDGVIFNDKTNSFNEILSVRTFTFKNSGF